MIEIFNFTKIQITLLAKLFMLAAFIGNPTILWSQDKSNHEAALQCTSEEFSKKLREDPLYRNKEIKLNELIRNKVVEKNLSLQLSNKGVPLKELKKSTASKNTISGTTVYTIPVVFHIVNSNPSSITDAMIIFALDEMNKAFAHQGMFNVDTLGKNTLIQFCLAKTAPDGGLTTGIDRINSYLENNDMDMEGGKLPGLITWDPSQYINIWVVSSIQAEIQPSIFSCGTWKRLGVGGYASAGWGVVVAGLGAPTLVHEMGHCLSLLHTFQGMNCLNNNCLSDGDLVCDTPPDRSINPSPCNNPENSCNTDTLSGPYKTDVKDNISNFMDYGSPCPSVFTQGQADRMRAFLEVYNGGSLISSTKCTLPCAENIIANFDWNSNPHPIVGDVVNFSNNSSSAADYKWFVNDILIQQLPSFQYQFTTAGSYKVTLQASNGGSCIASYTGNIIVNCGVESRFSPDKRIVSSKINVYNDSVFFWNKSYGASAYKWFITDNVGLNESLVSTDKDLLYMFNQPGLYRIRLESSNGSCVDKSPVFTLNVYDPTPDAIVIPYSVSCYKNDSLRIVFGINNMGYDTIPAGVPVSFYDRSLSIAGAKKVASDFITDKMILGNCGEVFTVIVKTNWFKPDSIELVFNENKFILEKSYFNNTTFLSKFQQQGFLTPKDTTVYVNSNIPLKLLSKPVAIKSVTWSEVGSLPCPNCTSSYFVKDSTYLKAIVETIYGCTDTLSTNVYVFPIDININSSDVFCYHNDSLLVETKICLGNGYDKLKYDNEILYFDQDSTVIPKNLLGKGVLDKNLIFSNGCTTVKHLISKTSTGDVYFYVNPNMTQYEQMISNNSSILTYVPYGIGLDKSVLDAYRGEQIQLNLQIKGESPTNIQWQPYGDLTCADCIDPILKTKSSFDLKVVASSKYSCIDSAAMHINSYYQSHIALPNAFSPNGNGKNDIFYVIAGKEVVKVKLFNIYTRWGEKIFEVANAFANDIKYGWNGTYKGKQSPVGTYIYYIVIQLQDGSTETYKGNISIIR